MYKRQGAAVLQPVPGLRERKGGHIQDRQCLILMFFKMKKFEVSAYSLEEAKATLQMDITINKGRGYVPADENRDICQYRQLCCGDELSPA